MKIENIKVHPFFKIEESLSRHAHCKNCDDKIQSEYRFKSELIGFYCMDCGIEFLKKSIILSEKLIEESEKYR